VESNEDIIEGDVEHAKRRREAWEKLFAEMETDPQLKREGDGFSGADHDKVLYGGPDGPA
jgi:hypothetical protein